MENKTGNLTASPLTGSPYSTYTSNEPRRWWLASMECRHIDMQRLLGFNSKLVDWKNPVDGWTAMHYAAKFNNLAMVKLLLKHHVDVNARSRNGQTPLHVAVIHANQLVIKFLVEECKADTSTMDFSGRLPVSLMDHRLPPEFRALLLAGRSQRIINDFKSLQPSPHLSRHNSHLHSIKSLTGHGREFKHPLLPSMSMILHRGSAASRQSSTKSTASCIFLPSSITTDDQSACGTTLAEDDSALQTMCHQPVSNGGTATNEPRSAQSTIGRRSSVWASLLHSTAAAAGNHRTSSTSLQATAAPTNKMFRSMSTYSACSDIRKNLHTDHVSLVSLSSNCLPPGGSTTSHYRKHAGSNDPLLIPSMPKHISANADLPLLSILLDLLPSVTLSAEATPPLKRKHKKNRTLSRHTTADLPHLLDGSGDHRKSNDSVCKPDLYRSPSISSVNGVAVVSRNALLAPLARRRANSMLANIFAVGGSTQRSTSCSSDSWLSQPS